MEGVTDVLEKPSIAEGGMDTSTADVMTPIETTSGLLGGATIHTKLGLKGGSKIRLGLFGGSPVIPPSNLRFPLGLRGGSKDELETSMKPTTTTAEADSTQSTVNGSLKHTDTDDSEKMDLDVDIKTELNEIKQEEEEPDTNLNMNMDINTKMEADSGFDSSFTSQKTESSSEEGRKDDGSSVDLLAALASAALDHSKEHKKTDLNGSEQPAKDTWYTVGFIKGNSCDVQSYFLLDDDTADLTIENLPELSDFTRINLEPGTAYKFRVAAINSVGRGDWSEVSTTIYHLYENIIFKKYSVGFLQIVLTM